ncbi:MAG: hypothetical protein WKF82_03820 [Nocardioidaceae bacterium]
MTEAMTEAELADYYNRDPGHRPTSTEGEEVPITVRRNVTISVRFSDRGDRGASCPVPSRLGSRSPRSSARPRWRQAAPSTESHSVSLARDLEQRAHQVAEFVARGA